MTSPAVSYSVVPNLLFLFSVLGIVCIVLRRLPEAAASGQQGSGATLSVDQVPADFKTFERLKQFLSSFIHRTWQLALDAKDLRPGSLAFYRTKKLGEANKAANFPEPRSEATLPTTVDAVEPGELELLAEIKRNPKNLNTYEDLGLFYLNHQAFEDAADMFEYLSKHSPDSAEHLARLGYTLFKLGRFDDSAAAYQKSLSLDSSDAKRYYNLGQALLGSSRYQDAAIAFDHAVTEDPDIVRYHLAHASSLRLAGSQKQSKAALERALELFPDDEDVKTALSEF